jgi:hypothetical protein
MDADTDMNMDMNTDINMNMNTDMNMDTEHGHKHGNGRTGKLCYYYLRSDMTLMVDFMKRALMKPQLVVERVYSSDSVVAAPKSQLKSDHPIALIQR